jgi:predicted O-methyltransferase YrrM
MGYLVEVGTTREKLEGQGSTVRLAKLAAQLGIRFVTVDMDPANTQQARRDLRGIRGAAAVTSKGEDFLASFGEPIVAAYLDAFDIQHGGHSAYRVERYRTLLDAEITDQAAAEMHRACAEALVPRMVEGGLIVIDDTTTDGASFAGKGATAVPLLLSRGFRIVASTPTAIALQRTGTGE